MDLKMSLSSLLIASFLDVAGVLTAQFLHLNFSTCFWIVYGAVAWFVGWFIYCGIRAIHSHNKPQSASR